MTMFACVFLLAVRFISPKPYQLL